MLRAISVCLCYPLASLLDVTYGIVIRIVRSGKMVVAFRVLFDIVGGLGRTERVQYACLLDAKFPYHGVLRLVC